MRFTAFLIAATWAVGVLGAEPRFSKRPPDRPDFFPIAVWLQSTDNAARYRDVGINTYVGLWRGPTEAQLDALDAAGIRLFVGQTPKSLRFRDRPTIIEAGLLADADVAREAAAIHRRIRELAPVLNAPDAVRVRTDDPAAIATLAKRHNGVTYVFVASLREGPRSATVRLADPAAAKVEVGS